MASRPSAGRQPSSWARAAWTAIFWGRGIRSLLLPTGEGISTQQAGEKEGEARQARAHREPGEARGDPVLLPLDLVDGRCGRRLGAAGDGLGGAQAVLHQPA